MLERAKTLCRARMSSLLGKSVQFACGVAAGCCASLRAALVCAMLASAGCANLASVLPGAREAQERAQRSHELQQQVMRFADEYAARVREAIVEFQRVADGHSRLDAQEWTVQQSQAAFTIASGANPLTNLLDMIVLASLSRMVMDDVSIDESGSQLGKPLRDTHALLEASAWRLADDALNVEQQAQLRRAIDQWRSTHPNLDSVAYIHFAEFAKTASAVPLGQRSHGNLFSLVGLDPLAGLDPAVREIAQARELAERSIFYLQRTPALLDLRVERLMHQLAVQPETQALLRDAQRMSLIGSASDRLVTALPDLLAKERAAALSQLIRELDLRSGKASALSRDLKEVLEAGAFTAQEIDAAARTLDRLTTRYLARPATKAPDTPFNAEDYRRLLQDAGATSRELHRLATSLEHLLPATSSLLTRSSTTARALLGHVFLQLVSLMIIATGCVLLVALIVRRGAPRAAHPIDTPA